MGYMFAYAAAFNQPLTRDGNKWDTSNVGFLDNMFNGAAAFNQDLTDWCVTGITTLPENFALNSVLTAANLPSWGNCGNPLTR